MGHEDPGENLRSKTHVGATGNLGLDRVEKRLADERERIARDAAVFKDAIANLLGIPYPDETRTFPPDVSARVPSPSRVTEAPLRGDAGRR